MSITPILKALQATGLLHDPNAVDPNAGNYDAANTFGTGPLAPTQQTQPQTPPQPQVQDPLQGLRDNVNTANANYQGLVGQSPTPLPTTHPLHLNNWQGIIAGLTALAADRSGHINNSGTEALNNYVSGMGKQNDIQNQNAQIQAQNANAQRQAQVQAAGLGAQTAQNQLGAAVQQRQNELQRQTEMYKADQGVYGKTQTAQIAANSREAVATINSNVRKTIADGYQADKNIKTFMDTIANPEASPDQKKAAGSALRAVYGDKGFAGLSDDQITGMATFLAPKAVLQNAQAGQAKAKADELNAQAGLMRSQYGLAPAKVAQIQAITKDIPGLDAMKIAEGYANVQNIGSQIGDRGFRQTLATNAQAQKNYASMISGLRDQLTTISSQANALRNERGRLEGDLVKFTAGSDEYKQATQRISDIDKTVAGMKQTYDELSKGSSAIQKKLGMIVDANGQIVTPQVTVTPGVGGNVPIHIQGPIGNGTGIAPGGKLPDGWKVIK